MAQDVKHLVAQKLKEIKQWPNETMQEYDKRFKYLLIQISYVIDENLSIQWHVVGLLQKICGPLRMHEVKMC